MKKYDKPTITIIHIDPQDVITLSDLSSVENTYDASGRSDWFMGE